MAMETKSNVNQLTSMISYSSFQPIPIDQLPKHEPIILVQVCDVLGVEPHGLSRRISTRYPRASIYKNRKPQVPDTKPKVTHVDERVELGSCIMSGLGHIVIANLVARWRPGPVGSFYWYKYEEAPTSQGRETKRNRLRWMNHCLTELGTWLSTHILPLKQDVHLAIPYDSELMEFESPLSCFMEWVQDRIPNIRVHVVELQ